MSHVDELSNDATARPARDRRSRRSPSGRTLGLLFAALYFGLVGSFLATSYAHHLKHQPVQLDAKQYDAYLAGFAFGSQQADPNEGSDSDYCDTAGHNLNGVPREWPYFSEGCQDAEGWVAGDPPMKPRTLADLNNPD
jgi:hypothetical protein